MDRKFILYRAALFTVLIFSGIFLLYKAAHAGDGAAVETDGGYYVSDADAAVTDQIVVSATNYLQLTSCDGIEKAPEIKKAIEPVERMILDISEDDIYMLACQVFVEAGAEPYDAQVGVAEVILNRVKSSKFPNSIPEVLYEDGQFPPAYNGLLSRAMSNGSGYEVWDATMDALYGADPVGTYLYFNMARGVDLSTCRSFMRIGDTVFYTPFYDDEE